jgi:uncharacterized protein YndB with AHSA1/START domain
MNAVVSPAVVEVRRVIAASPAALFAAWLDPKAVGTWLCPFDGTHTVARIDSRVGGRFQFDMYTPRGVVEHRGEYVEIVADEKLVFTWNSPHTGGDSLVTVTFNPVKRGTEIVLVHEKLPADKLDAHNGGWNSGLDKLVAYAASHLSSGAST